MWVYERFKSKVEAKKYCANLIARGLDAKVYKGHREHVVQCWYPRNNS